MDTQQAKQTATTIRYYDMKITKQKLRKLHACEDGYDYWIKTNEPDLFKFCRRCLTDDHFDYANWLIVRCMTRPQYLRYAIYSAMQVIDIYEAEHPDDKRPRAAINAAKKVLKNDTPENREAAADAYTDAAYTDAAAAYTAAAADAAYADAAAAYTAADADAAYTDADAAYTAAAADAAYADAAAAYTDDAAAYTDAAADAAYADAAAAYTAADAAAAYTAAAAAAAYAAAYAADAADAAMKSKIINYGIKIMKGE